MTEKTERTQKTHKDSKDSKDSLGNPKNLKKLRGIRKGLKRLKIFEFCRVSPRVHNSTCRYLLQITPFEFCAFQWTVNWSK
jgi:hypothetical protein